MDVSGSSSAAAPMVPPEAAAAEALAASARWKRRARIADGVAVLLIAADVVLTPLVFVSSRSSAGPPSPVPDWPVVALARDLAMVLFFWRSWRLQDEAARHSMRGWYRRIAMAVFLYGVCRFAMVDFSAPDVASSGVIPMFALAIVTATALPVIAHVQLKLWRRFAKEEEEARQRLAAAGGATNDSNEQYSSRLTLFETVKVMKPYFWPSSGTTWEVTVNRTRAISTWVCVGGSKVCNLVSPVFLARATNGITQLVARHEVDISADVVFSLIMYAGLIFLSKVLKELQSLVYIKVQQAAYIEIADNTFVHLHSLSLDWHLRKKQGNVVRSMDRGLQAAQQTMQYLFLYLLPTIGECVAVSMIFVFHFDNTKLAVFVGMNLYIYAYATVKLTLWRKKFRTGTTKHDNELHDRLNDSLINFETVKYFTGEDYERREYRKSVIKYQQMSMATQASLSLLNIIQQIFINMALAGGTIIETGHLLQGDGDIGKFVAVNAYILNCFTPLSFLGTIYNMVITALVDMYSFGQLLAEKSDVVDEPGAHQLDVTTHFEGVPMVEFMGVGFHYKKQPTARWLRDISFATPRGSSVALVGSTGSGKTTITRLLFRFYDVTHGEIRVNGQNTRYVTQRSLRKAMGFVPQDVVMFNSSIAHNLRYGNIDHATQEDIEKAARNAQLSEFIEQQPDRYETVVGERGLKLSGGEKQRLAIARCLVKDPPIVVLDEATSALDTQTEQMVQQALTVLSKSRTVLTIAHRLSTIRHADLVCVLESGQLVEKGSHEELMTQEGSRYARMWQRQAAGLQDGLEEQGAAGLGAGAMSGP